MRRSKTLLLLATFGVAGGVWWLSLPPTPRRVALVMDPGLWPGLSPEEVRGLRVILSDHLESMGGVTVTREDPDHPVMAPDLVKLSLSGERRAGQFLLSAELSGLDRPSRKLQVSHSAPMDGVHQVVDETLGRWWHRSDALDPKRTESFWPLCRVLEAPYSAPNPQLPALLKDAEALRGADPSGLTQVAVAHLRYRLLLDDSAASTAHGTGDCEEDFQLALKRTMNCPRMVMLYANFHTDLGDQRSAIELLLKSIDRQPHVAGLYDSLAYAARTLGLLEGAKRAIRRRDQLGGRVGLDYFLAENTYLYAGEWAAFEQSLRGEAHEPVQDFYRGYAALLRNDRASAQTHFRQATQDVGGIQVFKHLSEIYLLALQGHKDQALQKLRALDESRVSLTVPDGEFTFKLAEAYGFLDHPPETLDLARRAFSQGFVCADWYARSPFLACLQGEPQWEAFLWSLRDRQRRLEQRFPADRFGK
jgi:hypothetical protein